MSSYQKALDGLNQAQRLAVETTDGPVLVIAGPGTGKTQLLTTRIAHILATTDTLPQNILCLTFTDSAAQTMRERLAGMIGQAAYDVRISTYHAFGAELIRRFPDYFAETAGMRAVDDLGIDAIFRQIIARLPYDNPLKFADFYLGDIKTLVSDAKRALLTPDDLRAVASHNDAFLAAAQPAVQACLGGVKRVDKKSVEAFEKLLNMLSNEIAAVSALPPGIVPLQRLATESLRQALLQTDESASTKPLTAWKNAWLAKDASGQFILEGTRANHKIRALAGIYQSYLDELAARQLFDYDDMILRAVHTLAANTDLRYTLQEQYLYILLDEFQDTNGAQLRLVELLTDNPASEGRPNVLAVGDDDQAIYAFQGADYSHMLRFQQLYRDVLVVPLTQNYRSHADILHVAQGIAGQIEERLHHHFPGIDKTLTAASTTLPPAAVIERRDAPSDAAQFAWVAQKIRVLINGGMPASDIAVLAPQHKYLEPLVAYLQQAGVGVQYDKRENVLDDPAVGQLITMSRLCLALADGEKRAADSLWPEVLSCDFWNVPTSTIWQLGWQADSDSAGWTNALLQNPQLRPIALFFIRLSLLAGSETLETMLDYLVGVAPLDLHEPDRASFQSPFHAFYFAGAEGLSQAQTSPAASGKPAGEFWHLLTNLTVLRARLRDYLAGEERPLLLRDFISFAEAHRAANIKILNTSPHRDSADAVQLMTAFKAKGQEFASVFLLAVNDQAWGEKARGQGNRLVLPPNLQFIRYAGATADERLRLFYVAVTRAKSHLYLANYMNDFAGKTTARLAYLNETPDEQGEMRSPLLPPGSQRVLPAANDEAATPGSDAPARELAAYWQQRHIGSLTHEDNTALLRERLRVFQLSPTHVNSFVDLEHAGPAYFFMNTILRFPKSPTPNGQFGNAMHEALEWLHLANKRAGKLPPLDALLNIFDQRLLAKRLSDQDTAQLRARGHRALRAYLSQRGHTVLAGNEAEYNFRGEGVFAGPAHLSGKVDKLVIDRQAKTISITDYKTGKSHARWTRETKLHLYKLQLYLYKLLVERSHTFAGFRVTGACLEFIEPDEAGQITELRLEFDSEGVRRAEQLAQAVWHRVQNLDLPDITPYSQDLKGIEQFEADLLQEAEKP